MKMTEVDVQMLALAGESETIEFKRSTGQLPRGGETLCAFLNGSGGQVIFGVAPDSQVVGQSVSDTTMQDVAQVIRRFEPPAPVEIERVPLGSAGRFSFFVFRTAMRRPRRSPLTDGPINA
ncbi:MAG: ATP-binding protein [Acidobacteria bacterium]|nr:ATP-binding protein [Acidobacteriota bacterium]